MRQAVDMGAGNLTTKVHVTKAQEKIVIHKIDPPVPPPIVIAMKGGATSSMSRAEETERNTRGVLQPSGSNQQDKTEPGKISSTSRPLVNQPPGFISPKSGSKTQSHPPPGPPKSGNRYN
jgi:hypothetical protein